MEPAEVRVRLWNLLAGFMVTQAISVAVQLGIPDAIEGDPVTVADLAPRVDTDEESLYRLMRALAAEGVFAEVEPRRFGHTPLSLGLTATAPMSMRQHALMLGREHYRAWSEAVHAFRTGEPTFERVLGLPFFDYLAAHPELEANFAQAMSSGAAARAAALLAFDWSSVGSVADVGGGSGTALAAVLAANPHLHGTLFDLPTVVSRAEDVLEREGVRDRCELVGGSFFTDPLPHADVVVLAQVLHDWDDDRARRILANCRRSIGDGILLLAEGVLPDGPERDFGKLFDLHMLVLVGGKERTERDWRDLLATEGFELLPASRDGLLQARLAST
jgi:SAM-dependent methyltransferase